MRSANLIILFSFRRMAADQNQLPTELRSRTCPHGDVEVTMDY